MNQINKQQSAQQKDAVLQASIDFISTLTGMTPPPIEVAPPELFAPFKAFADQVCVIFAQPLAPVSGLRCACVFHGDECVEQCKLHAAWEETLHDQAEELKHLRAAVAKAGGATPFPAWCASVDAELAATAEADARPVEEKRSPMFWVRLLNDGLYEGLVHNNSVRGKMLRDEKPDQWVPLYRQEMHPPTGWTLVPINDLKELYHSIHGNRFMGEEWEKKCISSMMPKEPK